MSLEVKYSGGFKFLLNCRGHEVVSDQPASQGGGDEGMTPPELFAGALGACIGVYVVNFCQNHGIPTDNMEIKVSWRKHEDPKRIGEIDVKILLPNLDEKLRKPILKVAESCLIHRTIQNSPQVRINLNLTR